MIFRCLAISYQTVRAVLDTLVDMSMGGAAYLALASLTRTLGLARSSLSRWLCSIKRRSFSSDIDWRPPPRELMMTKKVGSRGSEMFLLGDNFRRGKLEITRMCFQ